MFKSVQGILEHNNNPGLTVIKQFYVAFSATKKAWEGALQIMVVDGTFQMVPPLIKVSCLLPPMTETTIRLYCPMEIVKPETEDSWVWFRCSWSRIFHSPMFILWTTERALRVTSSMVISEIPDACLQDA